MEQHKNTIWGTVREISRLSIPYFNSEEKWFARGAMLTIIAGALASVAVSVRLNTWNRDFFNAFQQLDMPLWTSQVWVFLYVVAAQIVLGMILIYLTQLLEIRWRKWMTRQYLDRWLDRNAHYRMQMGLNAVDNPDQRISMDIPLFIQRTLHMTIGDRALGPGGSGLLTAFATLFSFSVILWNLSSMMPVTIFGEQRHIPGFLLWAALIYSLVSTVATHVFGRQLIPLRFDQQRYEADFRFDLVRVRENSEQIALLEGEPVEKKRLMGSFGHVARNWHALMSRTVKLQAVTGSITGLSLILPSLLVAPAFFAGTVGYGELMQISSAFLSIQMALSFFVANYPLVAEWKALVDRLGGLDQALDASLEQAKCSALDHGRDGDLLQSGPLKIQLPDGVPLIEADPITLDPGDRVLITGPTGSGKSTTFRVLSGIWPFAHGRVRIPAGAKLMVLPQKPYVPIGLLAEALTFPLPIDAVPPEMLQQTLTDVGLHNFVGRLYERGRWDRSMSGGEQQRLAIARALIHRPDYLFLDEATASLDEPSEARLYELLRERLPVTALVSIGHRSTLRVFHERRFVVTRDQEITRLVETAGPHEVPTTGTA